MVSYIYIIIIIIIICLTSLPKVHIVQKKTVPNLATFSRRIYIIAADRNPPRGKKRRVGVGLLLRLGKLVLPLLFPYLIRHTLFDVVVSIVSHQLVHALYRHVIATILFYTEPIGF